MKAIINRYRYWKAGRRAVKQAQAIINGEETYTDKVRRMRAMIVRYTNEPNERLWLQMVKLHKELIYMDAIIVIPTENKASWKKRP